MPIYRIDDNKIIPIQSTTFKEQGLLERSDLQALLKTRIDVISPDTLIVDEEFNDWDREDSRRRIDLLGIDKDANLVVIELKRTESGGHMELQAIRYAAMISTLTFDRLVEIYERYLSENNLGNDARGRVLEFLTPDDPDDEEFDQEIKEVKIVLVSAEFSKEVTTSVLWLNDRGLDIRCVRLRPCDNDGQVLLDVQTVIPIPDAEEYQVGIREKMQRQRTSKRSERDKYDVTIGGERDLRQTKRGMMWLLVSEILKNGGTPQQILEVIPEKFFKCYEGDLDSEQVRKRLDDEGRYPPYYWFFYKDEELIHVGDKTCVLYKIWNGVNLDAVGRAEFGVVERLKEMFPELNIEYKLAEQDDA